LFIKDNQINKSSNNQINNNRQQTIN